MKELMFYTRATAEFVGPYIALCILIILLSFNMQELIEKLEKVTSDHFVDPMPFKAFLIR
jgi:hypothetical protein